MTRTLTVPPARHCPTAQPAGAAILDASTAAAAERARHRDWRRRAEAELARLKAAPSTPAVVESIVVLEGLIEADAEAWEARVRTGRTA